MSLSLSMLEAPAVHEEHPAVTPHSTGLDRDVPATAVVPTAWIQTLGCKVNSADSDRLAGCLASLGFRLVQEPADALLRIVNTCSVTTAAAAQSRQASRKAARLPLRLANVPGPAGSTAPDSTGPSRAYTLVSGCWATSDPVLAGELPGVDGILTHERDLEGQLREHVARLGLMPAPSRPPSDAVPVTLNVSREKPRQRAFLKIQDGCDAHCTYCIIPKLRTRLWSLPAEAAVEEARKLIAAGHHELILTGIFLGAYGQDTALRRHQPGGSQAGHHLARLVDRLCTEVPGLLRLRLSSIEPGDLSDDLLAVLKSHPQITPHFHIPLQSGSDAILRKMNRQYTRDDFLRFVDRLNAAFDRPALTTDIVTGFPGEDDGDFADTLSVVDHARFLHIHAFPFSPRPGTAAARWTDDFVPNQKSTDRIATLTARAANHSHAYRQTFVGQTATVILERGLSANGHPHGRCERYFDIEVPTVRPTACPPGTLLPVRIVAIDADHTRAEML